MTHAKMGDAPQPAAPAVDAREAATVRADVVVDAAGLSDRGFERQRNEDAFLVATLERSLQVHRTNLPEELQQRLAPDANVLLLVVADGIGGHGGGDLASRLAVASVSAYVAHYMSWAPPRAAATVDFSESLPGVRDELGQALAIGDIDVQRAGIRAEMPRMGTTLTLAYVAFPRLYVSHVGDTRCYLFRGSTLSRLTTDHTLGEQLRQSDMRPSGSPSEWDHVLWNSLGGGEAGVQPEIRRVTLEPGDVVLLCSDGLTKHVSDESIAAILNRVNNATDGCRALVDAANSGGGSDNITAVIARFGRRIVQ